MYKDLVYDCIRTSHKYAGMRSPTGAHFHASALFTVMCSRAVAMLRLIPTSTRVDALKNPWDFGAIAILARALLEARISFYYLGIEQVAEDEWQCRWNIMCLHDCSARKRLFESLPEDDSPEQIAGFERQAGELRERLASNTHFASLQMGQQRRFLNGGESYMSLLEDIALRTGINIDQFRMFYRLLSSQAHALPMAFFRMDEGNRGRGVHSELEEGYIELIVSFCNVLLASSRDEMHERFKNAA